MNLPKVVFLLGPTASGKTALSIRLVKKFNGEIVSADSRQIYRGMDIGTAKATPEELKKIKHHLVNIKNPNQSYTLGHYQKDALKAIRKILKRGKVPILVGGTGLYISAVVKNLTIPSVKPNKSMRKKLDRLIKKHGLYYAFGKLVALDPEAAYIVDPKNPRRLIRALEIVITTGKPYSEQRKTGKPLFDTLILGLNLPREELKNRIARRVDQMIQKGLVAEVKKIVTKYGKRAIPFDAIGYREMIEYLDGKTSQAQAIEQIKKNTWHFARRQLTWLRRLPVIWIKNQKQAEREIRKFLNP